MRTFAFVFARGGSKGLPGKNIKPLAGVPLIAYSVQAAIKHPDIDRVYVSTDSDDIAKVAEHYGATIIRRPAELATDTASEWKAWKHAIAEVLATGASFDKFISLPATSPLRSADDISACLESLTDAADVVITVTPSGRSPYFNMVTREPNGEVRIVLGDKKFTRRQDAPSVYDITTVAYVARPQFILSSNSLFDGTVTSVVVPKERAVDIDDYYDFIFAEALLRCQTT